jgi:dihydrofolate reductase
LTALRNETGIELWQFGGGLLFRSLLETKMVDTVEIAVMPWGTTDAIMLGCQD